MSEKHKNVRRALNYFEYFLILVSAVSGCVLISTFASLFSVSVTITSSAVGLKICALTARIKSISQLSRKRGQSMIK